MGNFSINRGGINTNLDGMPSIDLRYGPYPTKQAAIDRLGPNDLDVITEGLTVGIQAAEGAPVVEWWFQPDGQGGLQLVEKQVAAQEETDPTVPDWAKAETKPSYTASEVGAIPSSEKGVANGVATLGSDGKVPQSQLPSYVDDVLEYSNQSSFPATGESGKIYVALDTNKTYRWSGSAYVEISQSLALGETSSTAFAGDRGKAIEDKIPSGASSSNKLVTASDLNGKVDKVSGATLGNFASFDSNGDLQDSGCNEGTFIKGVQQNGVDLQKDANGKVNVTVQDGEDGLSAFEIAQQQGYTGTVDQWLASLKANIGEFLFVPTDAAAVTVMATIGQVYPNAIDPQGKNVAPSQSTLSVILLMNAGTTPDKTMMIATQDDGNNGYEFVYAGDLQSAMTSNVVTTDRVDDEPTAGSDNLVKSGGVYNSTPTVADSYAESDLDISDEYGDILVRYANGHIQVKNFSSADVLESIQAILSNTGFDNVPKFSEEEDYVIGDIVRYEKYVYVFTNEHTAGEWDETEVERTVINTEHPIDVKTDNGTTDLDVSDEYGNVLMRLSNGHIRVKNFDSSNIVVPKEDSMIMEKKLNISNFSGWEISGDEATTSTLNVQLKYNVVTYEDVFDMSFDFICQGSSFELAFGKNETSVDGGTICSISSDNTIKLYLNNTTLKKTISLSSLDIVSGRNYYVTLKRRSKETTLFYITITDLFKGVSETVKIIADTTTKVGYMRGAWAVYLKSGTSATVKNLSICLEKDINLMIVGHSFIEGNSISRDKDKRYASIIADTIEGTYISGLGGATTGTFTNNTFVAEASFFPQCKYVFFNLGTNDGNDTNIINGLTTLKQQAISSGLTPIFATVSPDLMNGTNMHDTANNWIKEQEYYIDIATAFLNDDNTVNLNSLLQDGVHPTIETHSKIANICISYLTYLINYKTI